MPAKRLLLLHLQPPCPSWEQRELSTRRSGPVISSWTLDGLHSKRQEVAAAHQPQLPEFSARAAVGRTDMAWLLIGIGLAVLLQVDSTSQVLKEGKEMEGSLEQDIKKQIILGIRAIEPPEDEEQTVDIDPGMRLLSSDAQGGRAPRSAGDPPAPLGAKSAAVPEEDRDHIYHPPDAALEEEGPVQIAALYAEAVSGPEEDRDHLYHG
ncbi:proline-rich acidic protein 1 [Chrysemys picta bellii]|uniref:proline-rich acidic protein 1 n=1 Tax=Chrysemys picta bellii TaxID=8478 RepID=UPI0032B2CB07